LNVCTAGVGVAVGVGVEVGVGVGVSVGGTGVLVGGFGVEAGPLAALETADAAGSTDVLLDEASDDPPQAAIISANAQTALPAPTEILDERMGGTPPRCLIN